MMNLEMTRVRNFTDRALPLMIAAVFMLAATAKLRDLTGLYQVIASSTSLPETAIWPLGQALVAVEILVALALLVRYFRTYGYIAAAILSSGFFAFSFNRLLKDRVAPCHCFGDLVHLTPAQSCLLNTAILVTALYLLVSGRKKIDTADSRNSDLKMMLGVGGIVICLGVAAFIGKQPHVQPLTFLSIPSSEVLAQSHDFSSPTSKYSVVMFGDYQCPPCRQASKDLAELLEKKPELIRLSFRNLPLTAIHPFAYPAAMLSEDARRAGQFWPMHDLLYKQTRLDPDTLAKIRVQYKLDKSGESKAVIEQDIAFAKKLGLNSTPSFVMIDPEGNCWKTDNLDTLIGHLK